MIQICKRFTNRLRTILHNTKEFSVASGMEDWPCDDELLGDRQKMDGDPKGDPKVDPKGHRMG